MMHHRSGMKRKTATISLKKPSNFYLLNYLKILLWEISKDRVYSLVTCNCRDRGILSHHNTNNSIWISAYSLGETGEFEAR